MTTTLPAGEVHLWTAHPRAVRDPRVLERCADLLDPLESKRQRRFRHEEDRRAFLVAHAFLRLTLSRYGDVVPQDWRFVTGEHGRPEIAGDFGGLRFSFSHSRDVVAVAIAWEIAIGVDAESVPDTFDPAELFGLLPPGEARDLQYLSGPRRRDAFLESWTLKEAYLKARGIGLSEGLAAVWFRPGEQPPVARFADGWDDDPTRWSFATVRDGFGGRIAVAAATRSSTLLLNGQPPTSSISTSSGDDWVAAPLCGRRRDRRLRRRF